MWGRRRTRLSQHIPRSLGRRLALLLVVVLVAVGFYYFGGRDEFRPPPEPPPVTMSVEQEVALGRQAAPVLIRQHGGLDPDVEGQALVQRIGARLVERSEAGKTPYRFSFQLLADPRVVDVFALPGGPIFLTAGLAARLRTEGEFAAVLAHALAHIAERHATRRVDQEDPQSAEALDVTYTPGEEAQADTLAVRYMAEAGYDPRALIRVMETLGRAAAGSNSPAFFNTHPNPDRRIEHIQRAIDKRYPVGVPEGLEQ